MPAYTDTYSSTYLDTYGVPSAAFPLSPLDLECQLNLAGTWTDVTGYAYQREGTSPPVVITRGRPNETSQAVPATCAWQWNNRDGRFSPRNPLSPYYGSLGRNTPVRWSVPAQSNYLRCEANQSDRAYVNSNSTISVTGSLELRIALRLSDWQGCVLAARQDNSQPSWHWLLNADGTMTFSWYDSGGTNRTVTSDAAVPFTTGDFALKATLDTTTATVTWYTAPSIAGTYTQLGDSLTFGISTSIRAGNAPLVAGWSANFTGQILGRIYEFRMYSGIGGTVVADGVFSAQSPGATSWTDSAGNTWNLAGGAEISARDYRFHGELSSLPPRWDVTGNDQWVAAQAGGPLRRLQQGTNNVMSAMRRAILLQTGTLAPVAYWPMEDASGARVFGPAIGPSPMTWSNGTPVPAASTVFACSAALPTLGGASLTGVVPPYSAGGGAAWTVRFLADVPTLPGSGQPVLFQVNLSGGLAAYVIVAVDPGGNMRLAAYDSALNVLADTGLVAWPGGIQQPLWWSIEAVPSGSNVQYSLVSLSPGTNVGLSASATSSSAGAAGYVNLVAPQPFSGFWSDTVIGHVQVQSAWASLFNLSGPLNAWAGELAAARYARLAGENGYAVRILGSPAYSAAMGTQGQTTLSALLAECEAADLGQQYEPRQALALGYRTLASMCSQSPVLALSYSSSQPGGVNGSAADSGLDPTYDDALTANDWTVTRGASGGSTGSTWLAQLNDGSVMSISAPPVGAGDYAKTVTVNVNADAQLPDAAGWRVHIGTVDDERWPSVPVNLARPAMSALQGSALALEVGDVISVASLPSVVLFDLVSQLAFGFRESLGGFHWTMEFNCVPASPYSVIVLDDLVLGRIDTDGSTLSTTAAYPQTSLSVATSAGFPLWTTSAADFPFDISISGMRLTVTNITGPSSPQVFTVTPAVNGVQKTLPAGADVRLWTPSILALT